MLDAPEAIRARLDSQADSLSSSDELVLDVLRHQPALFNFQIPLLKAGEIDMSPSQGDARRPFIFAELVRINPVELVEIVFEPPGIDGGVAEHLRKVDIIEGEDFADYIGDAAGQGSLHRFQLFEEPFQNAAFDDGVTVLAGGGNEVENVTVVSLADAVRSRCAWRPISGNEERRGVLCAGLGLRRGGCRRHFLGETVATVPPRGKMAAGVAADALVASIWERPA
jgi:hypothetical protein